MSSVRSPVVAGQFYPASREQCRAAIEQCLAEAERFEAGGGEAPRLRSGPVPSPAPQFRVGQGGRDARPPETAGHPAFAGYPAGRYRRRETAQVEGAPVPGFRVVGGIAPHAGWICSGAVAGQVIRLLAGEAGVETFVVFGAAHQRIRTAAAVYDQGAWETPLGQMPVDEELAARVVELATVVSADAGAHEYEHSIEVEVPLIQYVAPGARLLPVIVSPSKTAAEVGRVVARAAAEMGRRVVFLGSTDLTHYGPRYRFAPQGVGPEGIQWAKDVNDRRLLDLMTGFRIDDVVDEVAKHRNACGPGAVAATLAAAQAAGATAGYVLRHTNSNETLGGRYGDMDDAVGYAGVVLGR